MATPLEKPKASVSNSEFKFNYDIFLSFRGLNTRKTFTDHLYHALNRAGFRTFRDHDGVERSENINSELQKAIKHSKMSVIVFSEDYVSSNACLFEVHTILEQCKKSDHFILPVFYDVDPARVKEQATDLEEKELTEKAKGWSAALKEVASMAGMVLRNQADGYEAKFIEEIVEVLISKLTTKHLRVPDHLIGMDSRTKHINWWFKNRTTGVGILVICGMGGIGKTTIAKVVYNSNCGRFDASSFLTNIREISKVPNGLVRLQRQLLSSILKKEEHKVNDVDDGCRRLQYVLTNKRVLLVLDDVDEEDQLHALFGQREWFSPGSKIIITTRFRNLLNADKIYEFKPEALSIIESLELFSWHAFGQNHPIQEYLAISKMFVQHCEGLPMALQVLGSSMRKKSLDVWKSALRKLEALSDNKILEKLEISFDSLQDNHHKNIFLDIACFFAGKKKNDTIAILDGCGYYTLAGIHNLIDRNLLTIENGKLGMHHLLQDMGKQIVSRESRYPEEHSRIWHDKESFNILNEKNGTKKIEGLTFDLNVLKKDEFESINFAHHSEHSHVHPELRNSKVVVFETNAFEKMCNLRLLKLSCVQLSGPYEAFPRRLRWLYWRGFSSEYMPCGFPIEKLVALDMRYNNLKQVLKGAKVLGLMKILNLSHSPKLAETPDFSRIPNLEKLILKDCPRLVAVNESIVELQRIYSLNFEDCKNLRKLPRNISMVESLEELNISGCSNLIGAVEELKKMRSLRVLHADRLNVNQLLTMKVESQASIWPFSKPKKSIQISLASLPSSLVHLSLAHCNLTDDAFPRDLGMLSKLQHFCLVGNSISTLPNCIKDLTGLQTLDLSWCPKLQHILWPAITLEKLVVTECRKLKKISYETSSRIKSISHGACMSLDYVQGGFKILPVAKVDVELLNNIGFFNLDLMANVEAFIVNHIVWSRKKCPIQILYEYCVFSTYFPGREVPHWFSNKNDGSTLTFTMTSSPRRRIQGVNLCLVYTVPEDIDWLPGPFHVNISNKSRDIETVYTPRCYGIPEAGGDMVWLSHWLPKILFKEGDEVQIMFGLNVDGQIKECGVHLLYFVEEKEIFQYFKTIHCSWDSNMIRFLGLADGGQREERDEEQQKQEGEEGSYGVVMKEKTAPERSGTRTSVVKPQSEEENALWRIEKLQKEKSKMEIRLSKDEIDAQHHKIYDPFSQQGDESCRIQLLEKEECELKIENVKKELEIHQLKDQMSKMKETMAAMQKQLHDAQEVALKQEVEHTKAMELKDATIAEMNDKITELVNEKDLLIDKLDDREAHDALQHVKQKNEAYQIRWFGMFKAN
ncbi:disease resistance protein RUN1-like isoform X1 [Actinidia eriantha]|uniref:disease resistance protein RUN1-like isoform X1 n=1 Tax=Actinidia eriantha TaxID=165200 RepID=UPI00258688AF|nr:disease resistance protein RUN1-like isoform X1 [Actinidia eriantha]